MPKDVRKAALAPFGANAAFLFKGWRLSVASDILLRYLERSRTRGGSAAFPSLQFLLQQLNEFGVQGVFERFFIYLTQRFVRKSVHIDTPR